MATKEKKKVEGGKSRKDESNEERRQSGGDGGLVLYRNRIHLRVAKEAALGNTHYSPNCLWKCQTPRGGPDANLAGGRFWAVAELLLESDRHGVRLIASPCRWRAGSFRDTGTNSDVCVSIRSEFSRLRNRRDSKPRPWKTGRNSRATGEPREFSSLYLEQYRPTENTMARGTSYKLHQVKKKKTNKRNNGKWKITN